MICFCCWMTEKCMKTMFKEEIDIIQYDHKSSDEMFNVMAKANKGTTTCLRWCAWMMSVMGHYMIFSPIIRLIAWIPLIGALISKVVSWALLIFAVLWSTMLHFTIMGVAWIFYRPLFGFLMLMGVACCVVLMSYGDGG